MRMLFAALLGLIAGYAAGVAIGIALIGALSTNTHDKAVEVATTSALVTGPIGALIGVIAGLLLARRKPPVAAPATERLPPPAFARSRRGARTRILASPCRSTPPKRTRQPQTFCVTIGIDWCRKRDLNPRPTHYECVALPLSYCGDPGHGAVNTPGS